MKRVTGIAFVLTASQVAFASGRPTIDPQSAYVLVDVGSLDDAVLKGASTPGSLTLAPYDAAAGDVAQKGTAKRVVISGKAIGKSDRVRQYLAPLTPGTWVIEGASGTAFALGSRSFAVASGQVIDLGVIKPAVDWAEGESAKPMVKGLMGAMLFGSVKPKTLRPVRLDWHARGSGDLPVPTTLATRKTDAAMFRHGVTFGNHLGGLVNRIGGRTTRPGL